MAAMPPLSGSEAPRRAKARLACRRRRQDGVSAAGGNAVGFARKSRTQSEALCATLTLSGDEHTPSGVCEEYDPGIPAQLPDLREYAILENNFHRTFGIRRRTQRQNILVETYLWIVRCVVAPLIVKTCTEIYKRRWDMLGNNGEVL